MPRRWLGRRGGTSPPVGPARGARGGWRRRRRTSAPGRRRRRGCPPPAAPAAHGAVAVHDHRGRPDPAIPGPGRRSSCRCGRAGPPGAACSTARTGRSRRRSRAGWRRTRAGRARARARRARRGGCVVVGGALAQVPGPAGGGDAVHQDVEAHRPGPAEDGLARTDQPAAHRVQPAVRRAAERAGAVVQLEDHRARDHPLGGRRALAHARPAVGGPGVGSRGRRRGGPESPEGKGEREGAQQAVRHMGKMCERDDLPRAAPCEPRLPDAPHCGVRDVDPWRPDEPG